MLTRSRENHFQLLIHRKQAHESHGTPTLLGNLRKIHSNDTFLVKLLIFLATVFNYGERIYPTEFEIDATTGLPHNLTYKYKCSMRV